MKTSVKISENSHLTTHHPVRNCQRSSDPPVRVPMAYAIGRFSDIPLTPARRTFKNGSRGFFPSSAQSPEPLILALSAYIRAYPPLSGHKKNKKCPGLPLPAPQWAVFGEIRGSKSPALQT